MIAIKNYSGLNVNNLELLGSGTQGKVYKIDDQKCIKIFKSKKECKDELNALIVAQKDRHFPRLYDYGEYYIVREYITGSELDNYILNNGLSPELIDKLIALYEAMLKVGYSRLDAAIFHIFVDPAGELKLIDTAKCMKKKTVIPSLLISGMEKLGYKEVLFNHLKNNRQDLYIKWINYTKINYKKKS